MYRAVPKLYYNCTAKCTVTVNSVNEKLKTNSKIDSTEREKKKDSSNQFVRYFPIPVTPHIESFYFPHNVQSSTSILVTINHS